MKEVVQKLNLEFDDQLLELINEYSKNNKAIEFSFRKVVPYLGYSDRATHLIHPYPAKLLMHIPHYFLNNEIISKTGDLGLDPFCGSGTVLLESILSGRNCIGVDANPMARLISKVKVSKISSIKVREYLNIIVNFDFSECEVFIPKVTNINHWFSERIQKELSEILFAIKYIDDIIYRDFFLMCFSACVRKVSNADPRVSVPVKLNSNRYNHNPSLKTKVNQIIDNISNVIVLNKFCEIVEVNSKRFDNTDLMLKNPAIAEVVGTDARKIQKALTSSELLASQSIDFVITSPPYAGAQKYIRASSLNLFWTELSDPSLIGELVGKNIGRETYRKSDYLKFQPTGIIEADLLLEQIHNENPLRSHIAGNYIQEMNQAFQEIYRVLKKDKYFILIAANNQVCGRDFPTQYYLKQIALQLGFEVKLELIDDIHSYGLMTKRNKTASVITREWITVFKKK